MAPPWDTSPFPLVSSIKCNGPLFVIYWGKRSIRSKVKYPSSPVWGRYLLRVSSQKGSEGNGGQGGMRRSWARMWPQLESSLSLVPWETLEYKWHHRVRLPYGFTLKGEGKGIAKGFLFDWEQSSGKADNIHSSQGISPQSGKENLDMVLAASTASHALLHDWWTFEQLWIAALTMSFQGQVMDPPSTVFVHHITTVMLY